MSAGDSQLTIDQAYERLVRLVSCQGIDTSSWELFEGDAESSPRRPWFVGDGTNHRLLTLGYTRRAALASLSSMCSVLAVLRGC